MYLRIYIQQVIQLIRHRRISSSAKIIRLVVAQNGKRYTVSHWVCMSHWFRFSYVYERTHFGGLESLVSSGLMLQVKCISQQQITYTVETLNTRTMMHKSFFDDTRLVLEKDIASNFGSFIAGHMHYCHHGYCTSCCRCFQNSQNVQVCLILSQVRTTHCLYIL